MSYTLQEEMENCLLNCQSRHTARFKCREKGFFKTADENYFTGQVHQRPDSQQLNALNAYQYGTRSHRSAPRPSR